MAGSHANNVVHFAIHADEVERARTFYEQVFGWRFEAWGPPEFYRIFTSSISSNGAQAGIAGALEKRHVELLNKGSTGFTCTVSVADINDTRALIEANDGQITYSGEIPGVGKILSFEDTEGNIVSAIEYEAQALDDIRAGV